MKNETQTFRPLYEIASEIAKDWKPVHFSAKPYLEALFSLNSMSDRYIAEDGYSMLAGFDSNCSQWKGEVAKRVKAEIRTMLKSHKF